jgi:hypothetical protein
MSHEYSEGQLPTKMRSLAVAERAFIPHPSPFTLLPGLPLPLARTMTILSKVLKEIRNQGRGSGSILLIRRTERLPHETFFERKLAPEGSESDEHC